MSAPNDALYDALEARDPAAREAALMAALPAQVHAAQATPAFAQILTGVDAGAITSRTALATLPVTRKSQLLERQRASVNSDPFGGFSALGWRAMPRARARRQ
jgi:phenylacetate-CoA ligase